MQAIKIILITLMLLGTTRNAKGITTEISTDVIPWNLCIMNTELGVGLSDAVSVGLPVYYAPWFAWQKRSVRVLAFQPECRWWLTNKRKRQNSPTYPGQNSPTYEYSGHFLAAHVTAVWYNVRWNDYRYQDTDRPGLGAGITYGYRLPLSKHWGVEFMFGLGFITTRYDRFHNTENGRRIDTRSTTYFGPDRLSISFTYRL